MKRFLISALCLSLWASGTSWAASDRNRQRLDELFIWKLSESLNLKPEEEAGLKRVMKEVKEVRAKRALELEETMKAMQSEKEAQKRRDLMTQYRAQLIRLNATQTEELDQLEQILGPDRMPDYVLAREKLLERIKGALADSSRDKGIKSKVQNPKIIEQK